MKPKIEKIIEAWIEILNNQEEKLTIGETKELQETISFQLIWNCLTRIAKIKEEEKQQ